MNHRELFWTVMYGTLAAKAVWYVAQQIWHTITWSI